MEPQNMPTEEGAALVTPVAPVAAPAPLPPSTMSRRKASNMIARASWELLKKDKEIVLFPILSGLVSIAICVVIALMYFFIRFNGDFAVLQSWLDASQNTQTQENPFLSYGLLFVSYFISFLVVIFFQTGIVAIVAGRLNGQDLTFRDGMNSAFAHLGKIALWSLFAATVGVLLRVIFDRSRWLGKIVVWFVGAAWGIATFFIVPVLILEDDGIQASLRSSVDVVKKTWGESLMLNIGAAIVFTLLGFAGVVLFLLTFFTQNFILIAAAGVALVIFLFALTIVSSTLDVIFRVVLYTYAKTGKIADGYSEEMIRSAFVTK